ncbi:hypothetical protein NM208_g12325 [Fusarium decemcellulare]|uniref:Uncharacterized protein n=1 Tax=Fusarium decemcellulare TaxID=57161 RepID=A0ACC1RQG2_9HYPO|nr:hypothetical protein NM208_g12325 [Fusarium decemcellulare]
MLDQGSSTGRSLVTLPAEILCQVVSLLAKHVLVGLRNVHRDLASFTSPVTFHTLSVNAYDDCQQRFVEVAESQTICELAREVTIDAWLGFDFEYRKYKNGDRDAAPVTSCPSYLSSYIAMYPFKSILNISLLAQLIRPQSQECYNNLESLPAAALAAVMISPRPRDMQRAMQTGLGSAPICNSLSQLRLNADW